MLAVAVCVQLVGILNGLFSHFDTLVEKHGLWKVETIGEYIDAHPPHARAVRVSQK